MRWKNKTSKLSSKTASGTLQNKGKESKCEKLRKNVPLENVLNQYGQTIMKLLKSPVE